MARHSPLTNLFVGNGERRSAISIRMKNRGLNGASPC